MKAPRMKVLGTCGKDERLVVYWVEGNCITVPSANVMISICTWDKADALDICRRNLFNFVEA